METREKYERCLNCANEKDSLIELFLGYCKNGIIINHRNKGDKLYSTRIVNNFKYQLNESLILYDYLNGSTFVVDNFHNCTVLEYDTYIMIKNGDRTVIIDELL